MCYNTVSKPWGGILSSFFRKTLKPTVIKLLFGNLPTRKISISQENYQQLKELKKHKHDSFNDIISRLLEVYRLSVIAVGAQNLAEIVARVMGRDKEVGS